MEISGLDAEIEKTLEQSGISLPKGPYSNTIQNFFFTDEEVLESNRNGKLLKLDLDVGSACNLACPGCYVDTHGSDSIANTTERVKGIIDEGADLGLKSIKIIGAGEPMLFPQLLNIVGYARTKNVGTLVFTAGHVIGDDKLAKQVFGSQGVKSGTNLVARLHELGASVLVKYWSADDELQNRLVAPKTDDYNYAAARDKGLLRLVRAGFNDATPTRLGVNVLLLEENYHEAGSLFATFNKYNIFLLMDTPVDCGGTALHDGRKLALSPGHALQAAKAVYAHCEEQDLPMIHKESPYFGGPPCSQLNHALHIGDDSRVSVCPGANSGIATYEPGNLKEIWEHYLEHAGREFVGKTSHPCPPREYLLGNDFGNKVSSKRLPTI